MLRLFQQKCVVFTPLRWEPVIQDVLDHVPQAPCVSAIFEVLGHRTDLAVVKLTKPPALKYGMTEKNDLLMC